MDLLRGVGAILTFLLGLLTIAGGLFGITTIIVWAFATQNQQPIDPLALTGSIIACAVGFLFLFISRTLDPEHGPVRSYRRRPRKSRTRA